MIIVAGGDSFIYGSELSDCTPTSYSKKTFSALISTDMQYNCVAWPGIGNDAIARRVIQECEIHKNSQLFVIVCWTFSNRYEFRFVENTGQRTQHWHAITPWSVESTVKKIKNEWPTINNQLIKDYKDYLSRIRKNKIHEFAEVYYRHVGSSEYWEVYTTLKEILYLQNYLKNKNIPFLFTCADNVILYNSTIESNDATILSLYNQIINDQSNWFWFPAGKENHETNNPRGFYQWAIENKYKTGVTHPLEQAHIDASKLLKGKFNELVKKFI